ncbi:hypothetical protein ILUMI_23496 [Ignelater luminosus]|uniref:Uncharacterized protein n=1 Tax=Ignelater luminosus TaxID=2038154 RepID=A0A8K0CDT1_IGNLU|nr:hypothetical protein ILUMI_23496 [Ignelater luminosus]
MSKLVLRRNSSEEGKGKTENEMNGKGRERSEAGEDADYEEPESLACDRTAVFDRSGAIIASAVLRDDAWAVVYPLGGPRVNTNGRRKAAVAVVELGLKLTNVLHAASCVLSSKGETCRVGRICNSLGTALGTLVNVHGSGCEFGKLKSCRRRQLKRFPKLSADQVTEFNNKAIRKLKTRFVELQVEDPEAIWHI